MFLLPHRLRMPICTQRPTFVLSFFFKCDILWPPAPLKSCYLARNLEEVARAWPRPSPGCAPHTLESAISPADTLSPQDSLPQNTSAICLKIGALFNFRRATPFQMPNNRDLMSHPAIAWANSSKRRTSGSRACCSEWLSQTLGCAFLLPSYM